MKTSISTEPTITSPISSTTSAPNASAPPEPMELPIAVYDSETVMQALRVAQAEGRDVMLYRAGAKSVKGALVLPLLTLIPDRKHARNAA